MAHSIGFDLGGTKMIAALVDSDGTVLTSVRRRTPGAEGPEAIVDAITASIDSLTATAGIRLEDVSSIGIAVPGLVDLGDDKVTLTNLNMRDYPLKNRLEKATGRTICLENDVNAGTWAEYRHGAGKGYSHLAGVFIGTGIGGGLILNGELYRGARGFAGELGHIIIMEGGPLCGCGQYGCLEAFSSRSALAKDAVAAAAAGKLPELVEKTGTDITKFKSSVFEKGLAKGNLHIARMVERSAHHLGVGLANIAMILNPEAFILGGGLPSRLGEDWLAAVHESFHATAMSAITKDTPILLASLGDDAVPQGAALLAWERAGSRK